MVNVQLQCRLEGQNKGRPVPTSRDWWGSKGVSPFLLFFYPPLLQERGTKGVRYMFVLIPKFERGSSESRQVGILAGVCGYPPVSLFFPRSLAKGAGDRGG